MENDDKTKEEMRKKEEQERQVKAEQEQRARDAQQKQEQERNRKEEERKRQEQKVKTQTPESLKASHVHKIISDGFNVCLVKEMKGKEFLQDLAVEKQMNSQELFFTADDMTTIIFHTVQAHKKDNKFRHLYTCYQRMKNHLFAKNLDLDEVLNYVTSYFSILFASPDALEIETQEVSQNVAIPGSLGDLGQLPPGAANNPMMAQMMQMMMMSQGQSQNIQESFTTIENEFYTAVVEEGIILNDRFFMDKVFEECQTEAFALIVKKSFCQLNDLTDLRTLNVAINIVNVLGSYDGLIEAFIDSQYFLPDDDKLTGKKLQYHTMFGRMLSVTVWPTESKKNHFEGASKMSPGVHQKVVDNQSQKFYIFYDCFQAFIKKCLKNKNIKSKVLQWFRTLININTDYFKMMPNFGGLTSKGCFLNACAIFLELCAPFTSKLQKYYDNFSKIDPLYCATEKYLKLGNCDKLNTEVLEEVKVDDEEEFNFMTECFFITHTLLKIGFKKVIKQYNDTCQKAQDSFNAKDFAMLETYLNAMFSMEVHLFAKEFKTKLFHFLTFSSYMFCYENTENSEKLKDIDIGWFAERFEIEDSSYIKPAFCHIPEFFCENISKLGMMYRVFSPHTFENAVIFDSITLFCLFVMKTKKVSNPHSRAEMLKFICEFAPKPPKYEFRKEEFQLKGCLLNSKLCKNYLLDTLMEVYGDVEKTGSSHQYYEKYHYRFLISCVFHFLLKDKNYQSQLNDISVTKDQIFDRFTHFLISDINEGFQTSISRLVKIKDYEEAKKNWSELSEEEKKDLETQFKENSGVVKWGMQLARSTLSLCVKINQTEDCRKAFMSEVNLGSFVEGLNYTLDSLVSDKGLKIKISNPKEYGFEPKEITAELILCYSYFGKYQKFVDQIVADTRSYKEQNFDRILKLIHTFRIPVPGDVAKEFEEMTTKCKDAFDENKLRETFMDDAPEEYVDQLFCILMENPVKLPSGNIVDLNQLKKHLMNDPTDPYTRAPMKLEDIEEMPELKDKIEKFRQEKLAEFQQEKERRKKQIADEVEEGDLENFD